MVEKFQGRSISRDLVENALLCQYVELNHILSNGKTIHNCILDGDLLNVLEEDMILLENNAETKVIPMLSPAVLLNWSLTKDLANELDQSLNVPRILRDMLHLDGPPNGNEYWRLFERFHLLWEALIRDLSCGLTTTLDRVYLHGFFSSIFNARRIKLARKGWQLNKVDSLQSISNDRLVECMHHFEAAPIFPGMDGISFERDASTSDIIAICYQFKYSAPQTRSYANLDQINAAIQNIFSKFAACNYHVGGVEIKKENIFFLFVAFRNFNHQVQLPPNTLVLDRHALAKTYGPSLSYRPQFLAGYLDKDLAEVSKELIQ
jgi:hypothetical protein